MLQYKCLGQQMLPFLQNSNLWEQGLLRKVSAICSAQRRIAPCA